MTTEANDMTFTTKDSKGSTTSINARAHAKEKTTKVSTTKDSTQKGPRANTRKASLVAKAMATITMTTKAMQHVYLMDLINSFHTMGTQQPLIELLRSLVWTGTMIHGILPRGIKTTGMNRIGLNHGAKVADGHGKILHLRMTFHLLHHQYRDNHPRHYPILNHQVFESYEALLH